MFLTLLSSEESDIEESDYNLIISLYKRYAKTLWKYAYTMSENVEISNDIISDIFLKLIENIEIIKNIRVYKRKSYLMSMVKNLYINCIKKENLKVDYDSIKEYISYSSDDDFIKDIDVSEVEEVLKHLPEPYKSVLLYRYVYEEKTYEEIAEILNINIKSIRVYKQRAINMLKDRLKGGESCE